jgi:hypothetical protein
MSYQMTMKRVCVSRGPQAVICKNKVQASSVGGSMKWDYCSWMRIMYLFSRCRYLFHRAGPASSAKLIAGNLGTTAAQ